VIEERGMRMIPTRRHVKEVITGIMPNRLDQNTVMSIVVRSYQCYFLGLSDDDILEGVENISDFMPIKKGLFDTTPDAFYFHELLRRADENQSRKEKVDFYEMNPQDAIRKATSILRERKSQLHKPHKDYYITYSGNFHPWKESPDFVSFYEALDYIKKILRTRKFIKNDTFILNGPSHSYLFRIKLEHGTTEAYMDNPLTHQIERIKYWEVS
jgi:hypothetical protein